MVIYLDLEALLEEIWMPGVYNMEDGYDVFFIGRLAQILVKQLLTSEEKGSPFLC